MNYIFGKFWGNTAKVQMYTLPSDKLTWPGTGSRKVCNNKAVKAETEMDEAEAKAATSASLKSSLERLKTPNKAIQDSSNCFRDRQPKINSLLT